MNYSKIRNVFIFICFMIGAGVFLSGIFGNYANNMGRIIAGVLIMIYEFVMWQIMNSNKTKVNG